MHFFERLRGRKARPNIRIVENDMSEATLTDSEIVQTTQQQILPLSSPQSPKHGPAMQLRHKIHECDKKRENPVQVSPIDERIKELGGTTVALEMQLDQLEACKKRKVRSAGSTILALNRDSGRLRQEIMVLQTRVKAYERLHQSVEETRATLDRVLDETQQVLAHTEQDLLDFWRVKTNDGKEEYVIG
ncbi:MAG: hypothetical protein Q9217_001793 [Psora testacea]